MMNDSDSNQLPEEENEFQYDIDEEEIIYVSKSEMKREAQRMHDLGKILTELNAERRAQLPISDMLKQALTENTRLKSHEAKRRHLNYVAKIIWREDIDAIHAALDLFDPSSESYGRIQKQQEMWRKRLVQDPQSVQEFIEHYPTVDRQQLRNLVRNAQKEMQAQPSKPGSNYRKLFQFLKPYIADN